jgi:hypothetical protein
MTQSAHQHGGSGWEFGTCLWSPARNATGNDRYAIMREPLTGDRVLHFYENTWPDGITETWLSGVSRVISPYFETSTEPPNAGNWAARGNYYRIDLDGFVNLEPSLSLKRLRDTYSAELLAELRA